MGNIDSLRDWGHAKDYVRMMWMILQSDVPEDWVVATGNKSSVRDFVRMSFAYTGIKLRFECEGKDEKGIVVSCSNPKYQLEEGKVVVLVDSNYFRPTEVDALIGDPSKANKKLGWSPKYNLEDLVNEMMESDLKLMSKDQYLKEGGYKNARYFE
jgi:GDPmannose 4,6-dehydratase